MTAYTIDVVLRDRDVAISQELKTPAAPRDWTEFDVEDVLREILRAIDRAQHPETSERAVVLRGFSWIVEPADGGVVIAIEIPMGAAVAGPFDADRHALDRLITAALRRQALPASIPASPTVH